VTTSTSMHSFFGRPRPRALAVLPSGSPACAGHRVSPLTIIHRMTESLTRPRFSPEVRRDGRGVERYSKGISFAVDVLPGFVVRMSDHYPVYSMPGEGNRWIEAIPEHHNTLLSHSNARCGGKLQAISQLVKLWQFAGSHPFGISSLYVDMMLASSDIASWVKSYGQCVNEFFLERSCEKKCAAC